MAARWAYRLHTTCRLRVTNASKRVTKSEMAPMRAWWLHNPCRLGGTHRFKGGQKNRNAPDLGLVAKTWVAPMKRGLNQKFSTSGPSGYIYAAVWGVPKASKRD